MMIKLPFNNSRRSAIVKAALWLVSNRERCTYTEGPLRLSCVNKPYQTPFYSDCSAGVTDLYAWGNANDPNDDHFSGPSDTGTLVAHGKLIAARKVRSADVGIFGPGDGWHAVLVTQGGSDPWVWSMGEQGDPRLYRASVVAAAVAYVNHVDTCPVRWFRYDTSLRKG
jgi:hypothetical protein